MCLKADAFVKKVRKQWSYHFSGTPSYVLARKLRALKQYLKKWNVEEFGNVENKRKQFMEQLKFLENQELLGGYSGEDLESNQRMIADFEKITRLEEISWRQK